MQAQPRTRPGQQSRPGDATGRKREQLSREHAEEVARREGEIAMVTAERSRSRDEDVIDPLTREIINEDTGAVTRMDADDEDEAPRIIGVGNSAIEEIQEAKATRGKTAVVERTQDYLQEKVIIRVNADLENVTLGYGNVVDFKEGNRYRVPRWVAEHLDEKGLVWH